MMELTSTKLLARWWKRRDALLDENDLPAIAREIAMLNAKVAEQFSRGPMLLEERDERRHK